MASIELFGHGVQNMSAELVGVSYGCARSCANRRHRFRAIAVEFMNWEETVNHYFGVALGMLVGVALVGFMHRASRRCISSLRSM